MQELKAKYRVEAQPLVKSQALEVVKAGCEMLVQLSVVAVARMLSSAAAGRAKLLAIAGLLANEQAWPHTPKVYLSL